MHTSPVMQDNWWETTQPDNKKVTMPIQRQMEVALKDKKVSTAAISTTMSQVSLDSNTP